MNESEKILYAKESGMSVDDINAHLDKFSNGGSYLVRDDAFERFTDGKPMLGYPDNSNYVLSSSEMDKVIENSHGDIGYIEDQLGFPNGYFGDGPIHRVDVNNPMDHDVRMATGKEMGGNVFFNTPTDSNGNLPDIKQNWDENNISPNNSNKTLPTISASNNNPNDISKLKGEYFDGNGQYHSPNLAGYRGTTSGGNSEAVVNQMANSPENVTHRTYDGFERGKASDHMTCSENKEAYFKGSEGATKTSANAESENGQNALLGNQSSGVDPPQKSIDSEKDSQRLGSTQQQGTNSQLTGGSQQQNSNNQQAESAQQQGTNGQSNQAQQPSVNENNQNQQNGQAQNNADNNMQDSVQAKSSEGHNLTNGGQTQGNQSQSQGHISGGSSGMSTTAANTDQISSGSEKQNSSEGMSTKAADSGQNSGQSSSGGMPTTAAGQSGSTPSNFSEQSHNMGQSM